MYLSQLRVLAHGCHPHGCVVYRRIGEAAGLLVHAIIGAGTIRYGKVYYQPPFTWLVSLRDDPDWAAVDSGAGSLLLAEPHYSSKVFVHRCWVGTWYVATTLSDNGFVMVETNSETLFQTIQYVLGKGLIRVFGQSQLPPAQLDWGVNFIPVKLSWWKLALLSMCASLAGTETSVLGLQLSRSWT